MLEELKKAFRSRPFWVSFCTCFVVLLGYSLVYWLGSIKAGEWIEYRESALHLALGGIYFGGFMLLFPFCVAFSYATGQVDEMRSGMMQWRTFRSSIWKYVKLKVGAGMIVSACAAVVPFILHAILWYHIALPIEPEVYPNHAIYFSERFIYHDVYTVRLFAATGHQVWFVYEKNHEAASLVQQETGAAAICPQGAGTASSHRRSHQQCGHRPLWSDLPNR